MNGLADWIVASGNGARRDPPAKAVLSGWTRATKNPEQRDALKDIPAVLATIASADSATVKGGSVCRGCSVGTRNREFNICRLMAGAYNGGKEDGNRGTQCRDVGSLVAHAAESLLSIGTTNRKLRPRLAPSREWYPNRLREIDRVDAKLAHLFRKLCHGAAPWPLYIYGPVGTGKTCAALALTDLVDTVFFGSVEDACDIVMQRVTRRWTRAAPSTTSLPRRTLPHCRPR